MKKAALIIAVVAGIYGFYEQSKAHPNVWISVICFVSLMLGLFFLNKKTPSNFDNNNQDDDNQRR